MRAVVGRMPLWAGENQDIYLAKSADVVDGMVVETAMLMDSRAAEYREVAGADAPDGPQGLRASGSTDGAEGIKEGLRL